MKIRMFYLQIFSFFVELLFPLALSHFFSTYFITFQYYANFFITYLLYYDIVVLITYLIFNNNVQVKKWIY